MNILVIGSGGREHALAWKLSQSPRVDKLYCAPGNAGIRQQAEAVDIAADEIKKLADFAAREAIDLTVVGPEQPLVLGISDLFESRGLKVFGPNRDAARLEGSKAFAKELMLENGIPTAACEVFSDLDEAKRYVGRDQPCVVKADGLAAGKGVILCSGRAEAEAALDEIMGRKVFGGAGDRVVIEGTAHRRGGLVHGLDGRQTTFSRWRRPRTTSASSTATRAPTPAAWAPTPRRR